MTFEDLLNETSTALLSNKVRTGLTMLGVIIGVGSVIAMLAIGNGTSASVQASIQSIGSNLVVISPGAQATPGSTVSLGRGTANTLTMDDSNALAAEVTSAEAVAPDTSNSEQVVAGGENTRTTIIGTVPAYTQVKEEQVADGSWFTQQQVTDLDRVAVLGPVASGDLFATGTEPVGQTIIINGYNFTVIGVTVAKGGSGFSNPDDAIYIPITVAQQYITGNQYVAAINIEAQTPALVTDVQNQATTILLARHNISNPADADFSTLNQADILATASSVTSTFTYLLAAIASISLLVGGIGIMNMMLTTVTERTREIGLRKAIGARKYDIRMQFLVESMMLTIAGGIIGIILGCLVAWGMAIFGGTATQISISSVVLSFGVSALIGVIFGYYPAARASNLNPIQALRFE